MNESGIPSQIPNGNETDTPSGIPIDSIAEQPDVAAIAGARAFERGGEIEIAAGRHDGEHVISPCFLVEIHSEEIAGLIRKHGIDPGDEFLTRLVLS